MGKDTKKKLTKQELDYSLDSIIQSCQAVIRHTSGITMEEFFSDDDMMKASAMDMQIIGNLVGQFPLDLRGTSEALEKAYGFRCKIVHDYGTVRFEMTYLWEAVSIDVYKILDSCKEFKRMLKSDEYTISYNPKYHRGFFRK